MSEFYKFNTVLLLYVLSGPVFQTTLHPADMSSNDLCAPTPCGPTPLANSCNEPCAQQCQESTMEILMNWTQAPTSELNDYSPKGVKSWIRTMYPIHFPWAVFWWLKWNIKCTLALGNNIIIAEIEMNHHILPRMGAHWWRWKLCLHWNVSIIRGGEK